MKRSRHLAGSVALCCLGLGFAGSDLMATVSTVSVYNASSYTISTCWLAVGSSCAAVGAGAWTDWQIPTNISGGTSCAPGAYLYFSQSSGGGGDYLEMATCSVNILGAIGQGSGANNFQVAWVGSCSANALSLGSGSFNAVGTFTITGHPLSGTITTNSGCLTLGNSTSQVQYYQFQTAGGSPGTASLDGCSSGLNYSMDGVGAGAGPVDPGSWLAVYPGESIQVCTTVKSTNNSGSVSLCALQAGNGMVPCSGGFSTQNQPRCVYLCSDGLQLSGTGTSAGCSTLSQSGSNNGNYTGTNSPYGQSNNGTNYGTNGIAWGSGTNLLTDVHGQEGFAALNGDLLANGAAGANETTALQTTLLGDQVANSLALSNQSLYLGGLLSRLPTNVVSNIMADVTNWPTNFPDLATISNTSALQTYSTGLPTNWQLTLQSDNGVTVAAVASNRYAGSGFSSIVSNSGAAIEDFTGVIPTNTGAGTGGDGVSVALGNDASGVPLTLNVGLQYLSSGNQAILGACKGLVGLVSCLLGFVYCMKAANEKLNEIFLTPQIQGNKSSVLGTNAATEIPSGLTYLGIVMALAVTVPAAVLVVESAFAGGGGGSSFSSFGSYLGTLSASPGYVMATALIPVDILCFVVCQCLVFKFVVVQVLGAVAQAAKMSLIS